MSNSETLRLAIAVMAYGGQVTSWHARMWLELGAVLSGSTQRFGLVAFGTWDINPVDKARNYALRDAIQRGADWLLMVDADTFVESYDQEDAGFQILRMISDAARLDAGIVVAPVQPRCTDPFEEFNPMTYRLFDGKGLGEISLDQDGRKLVAVDSAATAMMAINLHKATAAKAVFRFAEPSEVHPNGLSEDHEFCRQIRESGVKIYADTRVKTGHISKPVPIYHLPNTNGGN